MGGQYNAFPEKNKAGAPGTIEVWDLDRLKPNPLNPRGDRVPQDPTIIELASSIRSQGLISPFVVTPNGLIVAGHRRHIACTIAEVKRVRVIVQNLTEQEQIEIMLIENVLRKDLTPLQEARGYKSLADRGYSISEMVRRTGVIGSRISSLLALLDLADEVQELVANGSLPLAAVPVLAKVEEPGQQKQWAMNAIRSRWSVEKLKSAIASSNGVEISKPAAIHRAASDEVITRTMAIESLKRGKKFPVSLDCFARAAEASPCSCSAVTDPRKTRSLCSDCPYAKFLILLMREVHDARQ